MKSIIIFIILVIEWRADSHPIEGEVLSRNLRSSRGHCPESKGVVLKEGQYGFNALDDNTCMVLRCRRSWGSLHLQRKTVYSRNYQQDKCGNVADLDSWDIEALKCFSTCSTDPVVSLDIKNITTTSVTVEFEYPEAEDNAIPIAGVTITYTAIHNNITSSEGQITVDYPETCVTLLDLQPLTTYKISVVVTNQFSDKLGTSMAVSQRVDTHPLAPFSPCIISATPRGTSMTITWTAISDPYYQTNIDMYLIKYYEEGEDQETAVDVHVPHPQKFTTLRNLEPDTCYNIIICSQNSGGISPISNSITACIEDDDDKVIDEDDELDDDDVTNARG